MWVNNEEKSMNLKDISKKLEQLANDYARVLPEFTVSEANFINKKAKTMLIQQGLASQQLRDAAVNEEIIQTEEYQEYMKLLPEIQIINTQIRIYSQLSKNINSMAWGEVDS